MNSYRNAVIAAGLVGRAGRRHRWLTAALIVWLVALYSVQVGQSAGIHKGPHCLQKCQVDAQLALQARDPAVRPLLLPRLSFYVEVFTLYTASRPAPAGLAARSRAPPASFS